ncbi:hypothetical protein [Serratia proteamaculans]|uniref:hypothetical protein n=1 Tax=Serratia proteamaculans TaxID=28151 RepID=UPI0039B07EE9
MILFIFLTKSEQFNNYINSGKKIHPEDYLTKKKESATSKSILCKNSGEAINSVENEISGLINDIDGFIVFCDNGFHDEISNKLGFSILLSKLGDYSNYLDGSVKTKQYLEDKITLALKVFFWMRQSFNNGFGEMLRLPIRNFNDSDFKKTCNKISMILSNNDITDKMEELSTTFSMLKTKIRKPKKRPHTSQKFYVDEKNFFFEYGKELHAKHETDLKKGHDLACDISANFRFGIKIEERKHFNVCKGDKGNSSIEGIFENCHGTDTTIKKSTHINMFSNDYIA